MLDQLNNLELSEARMFLLTRSQEFAATGILETSLETPLGTPKDFLTCANETIKGA